MTRERISYQARQAQMQAAQFGHCCPSCGCADFRKPSGPINIPGGQKRYAICRNCGRRVIMLEKISL